MGEDELPHLSYLERSLEVTKEDVMSRRTCPLCGKILYPDETVHIGHTDMCLECEEEWNEVDEIEEDERKMLEEEWRELDRINERSIREEM